MQRRALIFGSLAAPFASCIVGGAFAADAFPTRPVRVIIP